MAVQLVSKPEYKIEREGFGGVTFTGSSKEYLTWPFAVKFAKDQGGVLQSLREAAAFRIEADKAYDADLYQATRTAAVYFKDGGKVYVAFDDSPDAKQNIILSRAQEGFEANKNGKEWLLSMKDKSIAQILKRAEKDGRIVDVVRSPLELATEATAGSSAFGSDKTVQALLGDVAEPYAGMLDSRNYKKGFVYLLSGVDDTQATVRPCGLGLDGYSYVYFVYANDLFNGNGRARGVRRAQKFSSVSEMLKTK